MLDKDQLQRMMAQQPGTPKVRLARPDGSTMELPVVFVGAFDDAALSQLGTFMAGRDVVTQPYSTAWVMFSKAARNKRDDMRISDYSFASMIENVRIDLEAFEQTLLNHGEEQSPLKVTQRADVMQAAGRLLLSFFLICVRMSFTLQELCVSALNATGERYDDQPTQEEMLVKTEGGA